MKIDILEKKRGKKTIIKDIHLELTPGSTTLIIGTSGAGKSTLINCIIGSGKKYVKFDSPNTKIAYIRQHPALNNELTVYEAIFFARKFEYLFEKNAFIAEKVEEYIDLLGLRGREKNKIRNLSGGQQQRVAIAKELIRDADILIADEIDTGLDCGVARSLAEKITDITKKKKIITLVISHNIYNIPLYDKIVVLAKDKNMIGGTAFYGTPNLINEYFHIDDYCDILTRINSIEEGGDGLGDKYINFMRALDER